MGWVTTKTIEELFLKRLYAVGKMSVKDFCDHCYEKRIPYSTGMDPWYSGGSMDREEFDKWHNDNWHIYQIALEELLWRWWLKSWKQNPGQQLVPVFENQEEEIAFLDIQAGDDWPECSEDPKMKILHNIKWKYAKGWRKKYKEIPKLNGFDL